MGGYDSKRGATTDCIVVNNTLYKNDTLKYGNGELLLQYDTRNNFIANNIMQANGQGLLIGNPFLKNSGNIIDYNVYFSPLGSARSKWQWKGSNFRSFDRYCSLTGNDVHSLFVDPQPVNPTGFDFHLKPSSEAIDSGTTENAPDMDMDLESRPQGSGFDIGAFEHAQ